MPGIGIVPGGGTNRGGGTGTGGATELWLPHGVRRVCNTALEFEAGAVETHWNNVFTLEIASVPAAARLRLRGMIYASRDHGNSKFLLYMARVSFAGGAVRGLHDASKKYSKISQRSMTPGWWDGGLPGVGFDVWFDAPDEAGSVKAQIGLMRILQTGSKVVATIGNTEIIELNQTMAAWGNTAPGDGEVVAQSWAELTYGATLASEKKPEDAVVETVITARDT